MTRGSGSGFFFGAMAVGACALFVMSEAKLADAAPLPSGKICSGTLQCDLVRTAPDQRVLPSGVRFAQASFMNTATDALAAPPEDRKDKRSAKREARKERRAARRAKRKDASSS